MKISIWILGDQLVKDHPAIQVAQSKFGKKNVQVVMIESEASLNKRAYHKRKLVLLLSAMRHFANELMESGVPVDYRKARNFRDGLKAHILDYNPEQIITMGASSYNGRSYQFKIQKELKVPVEVIPNTQFLVGRYDPFPELSREKKVLLESFYRKMRIHFGLLIDENGNPLGGEWNFDQQNRKPLPKRITIDPPISFQIDDITRQVIDEVCYYPLGIGSCDNFDLAVTKHQAYAALMDFVALRLKYFGDYEDAMSSEHRVLFHSQISPYLNIGLLDPLLTVGAAQEAYFNGAAPINSVEGFIRQIVGWREFIYWQYWRLMPQLRETNFWKALAKLPPMFWDGKTNMACLKHVFQRVERTGYIHHIERLMLISNFCLLAGIKPQEVNEWFMSYFIDAYDWVMLPNVLGMGLYADGGKVGTKPYIASANYIRRMSNYCNSCDFDSKQRTGKNACPFNYLYWNFVLKNENILRANPRMGASVLGISRISQEERKTIQNQADQFLGSLSQ